VIFLTTIFKQDSPYYEHIYKRWEPYKHYVPVKRDASDLLVQLEWAKKNPQKVKQIIQNTDKIMKDHFQPEDVYCYVFLVLEMFAQKLDYQVTQREGYEKLN